MNKESICRELKKLSIIELWHRQASVGATMLPSG